MKGLTKAVHILFNSDSFLPCVTVLLPYSSIDFSIRAALSPHSVVPNFSSTLLSSCDEAKSILSLTSSLRAQSVTAFLLIMFPFRIFFIGLHLHKFILLKRANKEVRLRSKKSYSLSMTTDEQMRVYVICYFTSPFRFDVVATPCVHPLSPHIHKFSIYIIAKAIVF